VDGEAHPLADYPRMDNAFSRVEFGETRYEISDGEYGLVIDFDTGLRQTTGPKPGQGPPHKTVVPKGRVDPPGLSRKQR
jgi:hypothetical protein